MPQRRTLPAQPRDRAADHPNVAVDNARNADVERAAPRPRARHNPVVPLVGRMVKRHSLSVIRTVVTVALAGSWALVIVEPFNHRRVAENNKGVRAIWACLGIWGFLMTLMNVSCLAGFRKTGKEMKAHLQTQLPGLASIFGGGLHYPWTVVGFFLTVTWVLIPFFRYVLLLQGLLGCHHLNYFVRPRANPIT